jgi:hypothetical protein
VVRPSGRVRRESCSTRSASRAAPWTTWTELAAANPLFGKTRANGTGLTYEYVAAERQALPPEEFARERLGWWDEPGAADAFGAGRWEACAGDPPAGSVPVAGLAVAVSYDLTHAAIVAAAQDEDGVIHVQPLRHGPGTEWVVEEAEVLAREHPAAELSWTRAARPRTSSRSWSRSPA